MTAAGQKADIPVNNLALLGIVGGLAGIYLATILNDAMGVTYWSFLGAAGAIIATVWGADAVRTICKYGIGTGVPSIGMLAFGMGLLTTFLGLRAGDYIGIAIAGPVIALVLSLLMGAIIGFIANNNLKMKIPTMQVSMIYIAGAASLIMIGYFVALTGVFDYKTVMEEVVNTGYIAPVFIIGALPMLHPFNACLGPDEYQRRTLTLSVEAALMTTVVFGIISLAIIDMPSAVITIVLGMIAWAYAYLAYWTKVKESGTTILATGLLPAKEE
jgi:tetrahydromethanopterin S-methyltransferase subunit C